MTTQPKTTEAENPYLTREDALAILNTPDDQLDELIARAEKLRRKYKGDNVGIHILTNARSGNCSQDCAYCAQSAGLLLILININGYRMKNFTVIMTL